MKALLRLLVLTPLVVGVMALVIWLGRQYRP